MSTAIPAKAIKVFLADDSQPLRQRIAGMLSPSSIVVGEGETPQGCIDGIFETHPDVVVRDVQLECCQCLDVLRSVRASDPGFAFVVFSNYSLPVYRKRYLAACATRFLDKSTEFDQLAAAVDAAPESISH